MLKPFARKRRKKGKACSGRCQMIAGDISCAFLPVTHYWALLQKQALKNIRFIAVTARNDLLDHAVQLPASQDDSLVYTLCCFVQPNYPSLLLMGWSTKFFRLPPSFRGVLLFFPSWWFIGSSFETTLFWALTLQALKDKKYPDGLGLQCNIETVAWIWRSLCIEIKSRSFGRDEVLKKRFCCSVVWIQDWRFLCLMNAQNAHKFMCVYIHKHPHICLCCRCTCLFTHTLLSVHTWACT